MIGVTVQYAITGISSLQDCAVITLAYQWCISQTGDDWRLTDVVETVSISEQNGSNTLLCPRSAQPPLPSRVDPNYSTLGLGGGSDTWA